MEEDIKNIEEMLEFKEDIIKYHAWVGTKLINSVENLLTEYKKTKQDNNNLKAAALKNDDSYKEVCNKNKELEENHRSFKNALKQIYANLEILDIAASKEIIQELLRRGEIRCVSIVK